MNFDRVGAWHPNSINIFVKTMKMKVNLHLHVKKFKNNLLCLLMRAYFGFKRLFVIVKLVV
jgi:hypothetical protein